MFEDTQCLHIYEPLVATHDSLAHVYHETAPEFKQAVTRRSEFRRYSGYDGLAEIENLNPV
jgi:hypothetical protein